MPTKLALNKWINSKSETKVVFGTPGTYDGTSNLLNDVLFNQAITPGDKYAILPSVTNGTGPAQRIGNQLQPLSLKLQLTFNLTTPTSKVSSTLIRPGSGDGDSGPEDITVHLYILKSKVFPNFDQASSIDLTNLLTPSSNSTQFSSFDGTYWPSKFQVNRELFNVISHKAIRLKKAAGYQSYVKYADTTGATLPGGALNTQDTPGSQMAQITEYIPLPKMLQYKATTDLQPADWNPFFVIGWTSNEYPITRAWTHQYYPLSVTGRVTFKFKDL